MNTLNRLLKKSNRIDTYEEGVQRSECSRGTFISTGEGVQISTSEGLTDKSKTTNLSALSTETDPRVKKLKKELEKINIAPKPKYIYFNFKK